MARQQATSSRPPTMLPERQAPASIDWAAQPVRSNRPSSWPSRSGWVAGDGDVANHTWARDAFREEVLLHRNEPPKALPDERSARAQTLISAGPARRDENVRISSPSDSRKCFFVGTTMPSRNNSAASARSTHRCVTMKGPITHCWTNRWEGSAGECSMSREHLSATAQAMPRAGSFLEDSGEHGTDGTTDPSGSKEHILGKRRKWQARSQS